MRERSSASPSERLDIASFRHLRLRRGWPASAWRSPQPPEAVAEGQARQTLAGQPPHAPPATSQRCGPATRWRATEIPHPAIEPSNSPRSRRQNRPKIPQPTLDNPDSRSSERPRHSRRPGRQSLSMRDACRNRASRRFARRRRIEKVDVMSGTHGMAATRRDLLKATGALLVMFHNSGPGSRTSSSRRASGHVADRPSGLVSSNQRRWHGDGMLRTC